MQKESLTVEIADYAHLGDCMVVLMLLNSSGIKWTVRGNSMVKSVIDALGFNLGYESGIYGTGNLSISDILSLPESQVKFLNLKFLKSDWGLKIQNVVLSESNGHENQFFQIDAKSYHEHKPVLTRLESINLINIFNKGQAIGIGGKDTDKLDDRFNYLTGELKEIVTWMKTCKHFFGVDSGMSHLAGFFQIPSDIVITHTKEKDHLAIQNFYNTIYPTVNCWNRKILTSKFF